MTSSRTPAHPGATITERSLRSLRVHCPACTRSDSSLRLGDDQLADDDDVVWTIEGRGLCRACGGQLSARVGGWQTLLRSTCTGCGSPLTRRQVKWCAKPAFGFNSICSVAWSKPSLLVRGLLELQDNLCGICCLPVKHWGGCEVDHVVPLSVGGPRTLDNLRSCHRACNQTKKARTLGDTRRRLGITGDEIIARTSGASPQAQRLLLLSVSPSEPSAATTPAAGLA